MTDQSEQNKSEAPTPFKLQKARQRGSVARGLDLGFAASLAAFTAYLWMFGPGLASAISLAAKRTLVTASTLAPGAEGSLRVSAMLLQTVTQPLLFLFGAVFVTVLVFEIVQTGFVFSFVPLTPDFSKLSPVNGFKRVMSMRQIVETGKNVFKLCLYGALAIFTILEAQKFAMVAMPDAGHLADALRQMGFRLLVLFTGAAVFVAAIDQLIARQDFLKRMRMSRQDIRKETRDREGDPRFKQRRRQVHREYAKLSKSLRNIRTADVLITNPTHYAVALSYDVKTMSAPKVVAQGTEQMALRLKRMAFLYGVLTIENRDLARSLYRRCEIDREIPEAYFQPVANIYRQLRRRPSAPTGQYKR
jgi:flagellar biosynthetic protein FlhB